MARLKMTGADIFRMTSMVCYLISLRWQYRVCSVFVVRDATVRGWRVHIWPVEPCTQNSPKGTHGHSVIGSVLLSVSEFFVWAFFITSSPGASGVAAFVATDFVWILSWTFNGFQWLLL